MGSYGYRSAKGELAFVFQSGLIVACYHGYVDVVIALSQCPYLDVNWQDNEGNTALITAAQAGKNTLTTNIMTKRFNLQCRSTVKCGDQEL